MELEEVASYLFANQHTKFIIPTTNSALETEPGVRAWLVVGMGWSG